MEFSDYRQFDGIGLAQAITKGELSAEEVLEAAIARAEAVNPTINAVVHAQYDQARQRLAEGPGDGPFQGVPYMLKDLGAFDAGQPCTFGSRLWADFVPDHDATYTERCKAAGLVIMGRTNTPELGLNASTEPALHGPTRNPWNLEHSAGGSSGGSAAAVAAGILPVAHATDGGGSIRIPAANCGLFGLKPTRGRNPSGPDVGEGWSGMSTGHVVSRSVRDSAMMMDCTHGPAPGDPYAAPVPVRPYADEVGADPGRLRIALMTEGFDGEPLHPECIRATEATAKLCEGLGHAVEPASPPLDVEPLGTATRVIISANVWNTLRLRCLALGREPSGQDVEPVTWALAQEGLARTAADYADAILTLHVQGRKLAEFFQSYNLILSSTLRKPPLRLGELDMGGDPEAFYDRLFREEIPITPYYNNTGCPAMTLPLHWSPEGLPVGVHFGAPFGDEATLFRLAAQLEKAQPWFDKVPEV
ncbi:MAG: amidase family protein [Alphaproteobacteria bacterium]|nr:amidase family protein [Alphaproteobacteria bacterium]MDP6813532.1 amidase family protein [Alphaproteobacteria bacterium]